jgi:hypothetical protein
MSPDPVELRLCPFAECDRATSSVGYRDVSTGQVVTSVEVPVELLERTVTANLSTEIFLSADGEIVFATHGRAYAFPSLRKTVFVDDLVEAFLADSNLQMEETTERELRALLERLQKSVEAVQCKITIRDEATN